MKNQLKGSLKIHTAVSGSLWTGKAFGLYFLTVRMISKEGLKPTVCVPGLIPLDEKLSWAAVKRDWTIIISNPAKKTCKKLWISIITGLMERWLNVMTRLVTNLSNYLKLLNHIVW